MTPEHKALVAEVRRRAERRAQTEGPFTKENLVEWRAAAAIESLSAQGAQPQAGEPVTRDAVAKALHAVDCFDADRDRQLDGLPPVDKWADPWLPTGKRQLEVLLRRADVFLASLSQPTKGADGGEGSKVSAPKVDKECPGAEDPEDRCPRHPSDCTCWQVDPDHPTVRASPQPANPAQVADEVTTYAERLATILWEKHYRERSPDWKPLSGDLIGLLTQIDNMTSGLAAIGAGGQAVAVKPLDDDQIMEIIKEVAPWKSEPKLNDLLTYEKSPPLFPQATYDAPSYRAVNFVRAVEQRLLSALSQPHPADERVVEALRMAHSFISREYHDAKSVALEGEWVSKDARPVFRALSDALAQEGRNG